MKSLKQTIIDDIKFYRGLKDRLRKLRIKIDRDSTIVPIENEKYKKDLLTSIGEINSHAFDCIEFLTIRLEDL